MQKIIILIVMTFQLDITELYVKFGIMTITSWYIRKKIKTTKDEYMTQPSSMPAF